MDDLVVGIFIFLIGYMFGRSSKKTLKLERITEEEYNRIKKSKEYKDSVHKFDLDK